MSTKNIEILQELVNELLKLMSTSSTGVVSYDNESDIYVVTIETESETGLLIGKKGETLTSIQTVLGLMFKQKTGEWNRVTVNVGDYREKEEDYLKNLAVSAANRARETGEPQTLYNLNPAQRRIIHMHLSEEKDVLTESMGEGSERYLVVKANA